MTLILVLANDKSTIMLADRRISDNGKPISDESNKIATFCFRNARGAVAFTGLAEVGTFKTAAWLVDAIKEAAPPDYSLGCILDNLVTAATKKFMRILIPRHQKHLVVVFCGYVHDENHSKRFLAVVSNCMEDMEIMAEARDDFKWQIITPNSETSVPFTFAFGATDVLKDHSPAMLQLMLIQKRPAPAIRDAGLALINRVAADRGSPGVIGRQCGSAIIPADPLQPGMFGYHSGDNVWKIDFPNHIQAAESGKVFTYKELTLKANNPESTPPLMTAKVSRNTPCPCKSGKKFKFCHGRNH